MGTLRHEKLRRQRLVQFAFHVHCMCQGARFLLWNLASQSKTKPNDQNLQKEEYMVSANTNGPCYCRGTDAMNFTEAYGIWMHTGSMNTIEKVLQGSCFCNCLS